MASLNNNSDSLLKAFNEYLHHNINPILLIINPAQWLKNLLGQTKHYSGKMQKCKFLLMHTYKFLCFSIIQLLFRPTFDKTGPKTF